MMASRSRPFPKEGAQPADGKVVSLPAAPYDDADLVRRLRDGNTAAFAQLYDEYATMVRGLILRVMGNPQGVDDITQEVFLTVVRRCADIRRPESLRAFVHGVAVRTAKDELRRRKLRRWIGWGDAPTSDLPCRSQDPSRREAVARVYEALDQLSLDCRLAFSLRHIEEMELVEASEACQWSLSTFKRRLGRAERQFDAIVRGDPVLRSIMEERKGRS